MRLKCIRIISILLIAAVLGGAECSFFATSGSTSRDDEQRNGLIVIIQDGQLVDRPVEGVRFESGALSGFTGPNGEFQFEDGATVAFFIGDIRLGSAVPGKSLATPLDLVPGAGIENRAVINIARLLLSLDARPGDTRITIPVRLHSLAKRSNAALTASIDFLDFDNDTSFTSVASQLVATLTRDYAFTAMLVDADTARVHLHHSMLDYQPAP